MDRLMGGNALRLVAVATALGCMPAARAAESVLVQCGQQYQAAKAAGTLDGADWAGYRVACAARLKAQPVAASTPSPSPAAAAAAAAAAAPPPAAAPLPAAGAPLPAAAASAPAAAPPSAGRAAMLAREKQCGAEWRADKVALVAKTPGLTWPRYWSACNTRLKAAVR